jgi:hypothetical protein
MVEPRDEFETTDDALEEDFEDAEGTDELGFDTDEAIAQFDAEESDVSEQFRNLVEWIVNQLVDDTSLVNVTADQRGQSVRVQVRLPEEDLGKVIGRGGRIAKSIRSILMIVGSREHLRVSLDIEGRD